MGGGTGSKRIGSPKHIFMERILGKRQRKWDGIRKYAARRGVYILINLAVPGAPLNVC